MIVCALLSGCASSWEKHYRPAHQLRGVEVPARESARVIEVEWERLSAYETAARERAIERDERPDQMGEGAALRELELLLDAVRVRVPADEALVLGSSRFVSTRLLDPYAGDVRAFAASVGGDVAIVSIEPLGLRETVEYATRTEWWDRDIYDRSGDRRTHRVERRVEERVPVVVPRESWGFTLLVLRLDSPEHIEVFTGGRPWLP